MADQTRLEEYLFRAQLNACKETLARLMDDVLQAAAQLDNIDLEEERAILRQDLSSARDALDDAYERARQAWVAWSKNSGR